MRFRIGVHLGDVNRRRPRARRLRRRSPAQVDEPAGLGLRRLIRVLDDWESTNAIPVNQLYSPSARRLPRVRSFIDFAIGVFDASGCLRRPSRRNHPLGFIVATLRTSAPRGGNDPATTKRTALSNSTRQGLFRGRLDEGGLSAAST